MDILLRFDFTKRRILSLRPVFTQDRIGLDFFPLVSSTPPDQKSRKYFIIQVVDHRFKLEQRIGTESPMRGFNSVPIRSDPMLIFLNGNRPLESSVYSSINTCLKKDGFFLTSK